jgi:hypothetical protein
MTKRCGSVVGRALIEKICQLLALEWQVVVHHSYHEANQYTDVLASYFFGYRSSLLKKKEMKFKLYDMVQK